MPHVILKRVWNYCAYSKKFLAFIFILLFISSVLQNYILSTGNSLGISILNIMVFMSVVGYGMVITRDRINHGNRLPKIVIRDIAVLGIKAGFVMVVYLLVQGYVLDFICSPLDFPAFDLEDILLNWSETVHLLYSHNPIDTLFFIVVGSVLFYLFSFFMEIALARLADTSSILKAFNFLAIKRNIDMIGWRNYAKEYTLIIVTIVFLSYLSAFSLPFSFLDSLVDMFLSFLIFATQYLGIGAVYSKIKDIENRVVIPVDEMQE